MNGETPFEGEPGDTRERILRATYRALQHHGYTGLSLQRIAGEADLSKSSVYHFYDDKDDLLVAFLDFMLLRFREEFAVAAVDDPVVELRAYLEHAVLGSPPDWLPGPRPHGDDPAFGPLVELRAQAVSKEVYRERFSEYDARFVEELASVVERGTEQGVFREVDPDGVAEFLLTLVMGAIFRRSTAETADDDGLMDEVDAMLGEYLLAED